MSLGGGVALSVLSVLGLPAASDDATPIRVELDAPPDCATAEGFYEAVRARTERARTVKEGETGVRVVVRLTRVGARAHGELRVIGEHGESDTRRVDGASCTEVVAALSLTVALAVDPTARLGTLEAPPEKPRAPVCPKCEPPPPPPPPPPPELEVRLAVHLLGMGQVSPSMSFGADASVRVIAPWAAASSLGLGITYLQNDVFAGRHEAAVGSTLLELTGCPKRFGARDTFTFEPCLVGMGGWLHAEGRGFDTTTEVTRSYFAAGALFIGSAPLSSHWQLEVQAGFVFPLIKRHFTVSDPPRDVGETPDVSGVVGLGAAYSF